MRHGAAMPRRMSPPRLPNVRQYLQIMRLPGAWWLILGAFPGRISFAMSNLGIFFHVDKATGSIASAGLCVGAFGLLSSMTAAFRGGLVDRLGQTRPLLFFVLAYTSSMLLLAFFSAWFTAAGR